MTEYRIKLNSNLIFDESERDIYSIARELASQHKLTETIGGLLRIYYSHPEKFEGIDAENYIDQDRLDILKNLQEIQEKELALFNRKLDHMMHRIIDLESNLTILYSLLDMRKTIGLPDRVKATRCASLMLKYELRELAATIGKPINMDIIPDIETTAEKLILKTIETYGPELEELKSLAVAIPTVQTVQLSKSSYTDRQTESTTNRENVYTARTETPANFDTPIEENAGNEQGSSLDMDSMMDMFGSMFEP